MLMEVTGLHHHYGKTLILDDVSFQVRAGEGVGIVGESGSGKSTLSRILLGLEAPRRGEVKLAGQVLYTGRRNGRPVSLPLPVSAVFQDYASSVNPVMTIERIIAEPLRLQRLCPDRVVMRSQVNRLLEQVGLSASLCQRFPHQLSGGQMQRVCIARALASTPQLIVLDEAVSALDMTIQVQILDLLAELQQRHGLTYLFISHDVAAITYLCQRVLFLAQGRIVEQVDDIHALHQVRHPMACRLLDAVVGLSV